MKLRKFFGANSRTVLQQVRTALGPDAIIVMNKPTAKGIEITAVASPAAFLARQHAARPPARPPHPHRPCHRRLASRKRCPRRLSQPLRRSPQRRRKAGRPALKPHRRSSHRA